MKKLVPLPVLAFAAVAFASAASAPAAATTADSYVSVAVRYPGVTYGPRTDGATVTVPTFAFRAGIYYKNLGPNAVRVTIQFDLPPGLQWAGAPPTAAQGCTSTPTSTVCKTPLVPFGDDVADDEYYTEWDVVADHPGTYTLHDAVVSASTPDPNASNNASTVTAVVEPALHVTGLRLSPTRPRAGSTLTARLGFTAGGQSVTPDSVTCAATVAGKRVRATPSAASGAARCSIRTPRNTRGEALRGTLSLALGGATLTRRFTARIR
jgi:hypothetical protein